MKQYKIRKSVGMIGVSRVIIVAIRGLPVIVTSFVCGISYIVNIVFHAPLVEVKHGSVP